MTNTPAANSQHFPDDATWQSHCQKMAAYRAAQLEVACLAPGVAGKLDAVPVLGRAA